MKFFFEPLLDFDQMRFTLSRIDDPFAGGILAIVGDLDGGEVIGGRFCGAFTGPTATVPSYIGGFGKVSFTARV